MWPFELLGSGVEFCGCGSARLQTQFLEWGYNEYGRRIKHQDGINSLG
jgi:hypothetical protein